MKATAFLDAARHLPFCSLGDVTQGRGIVIVAPHPDDEALGCGGLICQAVERNLPVRVVFVSDGTGSHPNSRSHPPNVLRDLRQQEAVRAATMLGLKREALIFLDLPDRYVPSDGPLAEWAASSIKAAVKAIHAGSVFVTWDQDPHCDHAAAHRLAWKALRTIPDVHLYAYPTWSWLGTRSDEISCAVRGFRLQITDQLIRKRAAVMEHRSQTSDLIDDDPAGFTIAPVFLEMMLQSYETFLEVSTS